jgi:hypothetical protein
MALGSAYAKNLARKPAPEGMDALDAEPDEDEAGGPPDEDADDAAAMSAYEDFARLAGFKPDPKTFAALKELIQLIK